MGNRRVSATECARHRPMGHHEPMDQRKTANFPKPRRTGITIAAGYCIFAGLSEVRVGITGNRMGIAVQARSNPTVPELPSAGFFDVAAGISSLPKRRTGALLGIVFILLEVLGRVHLVRTGTYPSRVPGPRKRVSFGGTIALLLVVVLGQSVAKSSMQDKACTSSA